MKGDQANPPNVDAVSFDLRAKLAQVPEPWELLLEFRELVRQHDLVWVRDTPP